MKKVKGIVLMVTLAIGVLTGCSAGGNGTSKDTESNKEDTVVQVVSPDGLPTMSIAKVIKENPEIKENYTVKYSIEKTPETLSTTVMKGEPDIAIVPSNMAAISYNKNKNYKIAGTTGFGSFYLVSTEELKSYDDLKGKTILNIGKGLTPDITAQSIMKDRGLDVEKDVTFNYVNAVSELVPMIISQKANTAIIPEPALSALMTKKPGVKIFKGLNEEYKEINNSKYGYPQATVIVKESFLKENKEFVDEFLQTVDKSTEWANKNPKELASYCEEVGVSTEKAIIEKSIEKANIDFAPINDTKEEYLNYYKKLFEYNPKSIGGNMPDEGIFMEG